MNGDDGRGERLTALFMLGCVLFNFPLLALFNAPVLVFGVPLLYAYLFSAWAALIALLAWSIERRR